MEMLLSSGMNKFFEEKVKIIPWKKLYIKFRTDKGDQYRIDCNPESVCEILNEVYELFGACSVTVMPK